MDIKNKKRLFLSSFENQIQLIYSAFIKKCKSKGDFSSTKRVESLNFINNNGYTFLDFLLGYQITHLYECNGTFVSFSFDFPKNINDKTNFGIETNVNICMFNDYSHTLKSNKMSFNMFLNATNSYLFVMSNINSYGLFQHKAGGLNYNMHNLFNNCLLKNNEMDLIEIVSSFESEKILFNKTIESQSNFIFEKRSNNRKKKNHKKNGRQLFNSEISKNNSEIKNLKRKIFNLEQANANAERVLKGGDFDMSKQNNLSNEFQQDLNSLFSTSLKHKVKSQFSIDLCKVLFEF